MTRATKTCEGKPFQKRLSTKWLSLACCCVAAGAAAMSFEAEALGTCRVELLRLAHLAVGFPSQQVSQPSVGKCFAAVASASSRTVFGSVTSSTRSSNIDGQSVAHVCQKCKRSRKDCGPRCALVNGFSEQPPETSFTGNEKEGIIAAVSVTIGAAALALWRRFSRKTADAVLAPPVFKQLCTLGVGCGCVPQRNRRKRASRIVLCSHDHDHEESGDHGHQHSGHDHGHEHKHEDAHEHSHGHAEAHSHAGEAHDCAHDHDHGHHDHEDEHDSHGHGHGCGHGCGHSHGEVPTWLPGAPVIKRAMKPLRSGIVTRVAAAIYAVSILPRCPAWLQAAGPATVFFVFGVPAALGLLAQMRAAAAFFDVHFLMTAAAFAAVGIGHAQEGALLLLLFAFSHAVEERLAKAAQSSLDALSRMSPETARRLPSSAPSMLSAAEKASEVAAADLSTGDRILVRAGEVVPVDGEVMDGTSQVSLDHLTGEPLPQTVTVGNTVISGAVSVDGALLLKVLRPAHESTIQRIARLTATAKASRPQLVTLIDAVASKWSLGVVASTALLATVPPLLFGEPPAKALYRALVWLVTASPCALVLATPLVYVSALSVAASRGILLKGARPLDALATARGFAFDKTGTITTGLPALDRITPLGLKEGESAEEQQALQTAAALGRLSVHPISRALVAAAGSARGAAEPEVRHFNLVAGAGVSAEVTHTSAQDAMTTATAALGRPEFVAQQLEASGGQRGVELAGAVRAAAAAAAAQSTNGNADGGSALAALGVLAPEDAQESRAEAWLFELKDRVKSSAKALTRIGRKGPVYMLTGDVRASAERVANSLGAEATFTDVYADLRPEEKLAKVKELDAALREQDKANGSLQAKFLQSLGASAGGIVMVGDGINDAPALAAASCGISLTTQADGAVTGNAVDGADVLVLRRAGDPAGENDLNRIEWLLRMSTKARRIVKQNLFIALCSIFGASASTLFAGLPLWLGVLLHEGATVLVAVNSLLLLSEARPLQKKQKKMGVVGRPKAEV